MTISRSNVFKSISEGNSYWQTTDSGEFQEIGAVHAFFAKVWGAFGEATGLWSNHMGSTAREFALLKLISDLNQEKAPGEVHVLTAEKVKRAAQNLGLFFDAKASKNNGEINQLLEGVTSESFFPFNENSISRLLKEYTINHSQELQSLFPQNEKIIKFIKNATIIPNTHTPFESSKNEESSNQKDDSERELENEADSRSKDPNSSLSSENSQKHFTETAPESESLPMEKENLVSASDIIEDSAKKIAPLSLPVEAEKKTSGLSAEQILKALAGVVCLVVLGRHFGASLGDKQSDLSRGTALSGISPFNVTDKALLPSWWTHRFINLNESSAEDQQFSAEDRRFRKLQSSAENRKALKLRKFRFAGLPPTHNPRPVIEYSREHLPDSGLYIRDSKEPVPSASPANPDHSTNIRHRNLKTTEGDSKVIEFPDQQGFEKAVPPAPDPYTPDHNTQQTATKIESFVDNIFLTGLVVVSGLSYLIKKAIDLTKNLGQADKEEDEYLKGKEKAKNSNAPLDAKQIEQLKKDIIAEAKEVLTGFSLAFHKNTDVDFPFNIDPWELAVVKKSVNNNKRKHLVNDLAVEFWEAYVLNRKDLSDQQVDELATMVRGLADKLKEPHALVYVDKSFEGYDLKKVQKTSDISANQGLEKTKKYPKGWYSQAFISNVSSPYVWSNEPSEMQKKAEEDFGPFISWNGGSNVHDGMHMKEPVIKMKDPFKKSSKLVDMPNSEFCLAYKKRHFFYKQLKARNLKEAASKVKNDSSGLIAEFMDEKLQKNPGAAQAIGRHNPQNGGRLDLVETYGVNSAVNKEIVDAWNQASLDVMSEIVYLKCSQNPMLREKLKVLALADRQLAYLKTDSEWGTTDDPEQDATGKITYRKGNNKLGQALENARRKIVREEGITTPDKIKTASTSNVQLAVPETQKRVWVKKASKHNALIPKSTKTGYSLERKKLHEKIKTEIIGEVKSVKPDQKPVAVLLMGPAGAGKSTCIQHILKERRNEFVEVGTDNVMERIPEYQMAINLGTDLKGRIVTAEDAWAITKDEAADINFALRLAVVSSQKNMIYDATGQNLGLYQNLIKDLKDKDYDVQVYYVDVDLEETRKRAKSRAEINGRFVAEEFMNTMYTKSKANFKTIAALADSAAVLDNRGATSIVACTFKDGKCVQGEDYLKDRGF